MGDEREFVWQPPVYLFRDQRLLDKTAFLTKQVDGKHWLLAFTDSDTAERFFTASGLPAANWALERFDDQRDFIRIVQMAGERGCYCVSFDMNERQQAPNTIPVEVILRTAREAGLLE